MRISSRTPEGTPNRCPVCGSDVRIDPSLPFGDAPCPKCGCLLWFVGVPPETHHFFEYDAAEPIREALLQRLAHDLGVSRHDLETDPEIFKKIGVDSLDFVELLMELEEEFAVGA
jgi:acyl carrier protein